MATKKLKNNVVPIKPLFLELYDAEQAAKEAFTKEKYQIAQEKFVRAAELLT